MLYILFLWETVDHLWLIVKRLISCGVLGPTKNDTRSSFWLEELVREVLVRHLESSTIVPNVVYMEGA